MLYRMARKKAGIYKIIVMIIRINIYLSLSLYNIDLAQQAQNAALNLALKVAPHNASELCRFLKE